MHRVPRLPPCQNIYASGAGTEVPVLPHDRSQGGVNGTQQPALKLALQRG